MAGSRNYGTHCNTRIPLDEEAQIQMAMRVFKGTCFGTMQSSIYW